MTSDKARSGGHTQSARSRSESSTGSARGTDGEGGSSPATPTNELALFLYPLSKRNEMAQEKTRREVDWLALTPRSLWILQRIALPISLGLSENEVANQLGVTARWIRARMQELREEIEAQ